MKDKTISESLDISIEYDDIEIIETKEVHDDYTFARKKLRDILEKGEQALDKMMEIADLSQHPRSYEVVSTLIDSLSDASKSLLDLSEKNKRIESMSNNAPQTINNNLYISTNELQKLIKQKND
jgi:hypothetical protein